MYSACVSNEVKERERERERGETKQFFHFFEIRFFVKSMNRKEPACLLGIFWAFFSSSEVKIISRDNTNTNRKFKEERE